MPVFLSTQKKKSKHQVCLVCDKLVYGKFISREKNPISGVLYVISRLSHIDGSIFFFFGVCADDSVC